MARIRSIKPELREDEALARCRREARYLFVCLISRSDDEGRARGGTLLIQADCFPYDRDIDDETLGGWLDELERERMIIRYGVDGQRYVQVRNWSKHQYVQHPKASAFPPPPDPETPAKDGCGEPHEEFMNGSGTPPEAITNGSGGDHAGMEGNGREWKGMEGKSQPDGSDAPLTTVVDRPEVTRLCNLLADTIAQDGTPRPDVGAGWLTDCRRLLDIDGATVEQVEYVIGWAHSPGNFWAANILSMRKLREKWTQMVKQINRDRASSSVAPTDTLRGWAVDAA